MLSARASLIVLASLAVGLAACGSEPPPPSEVPPPPTEPAPPPPEATPPPEPAASAAPTAAQPPPAPPLTDEQIAAITAAADTGGIDQGKAAATQAKDATGSMFAALMVAHHGEAKKKNEALVKKAKITPADSDMSKALAADSTKLVESWKDLKGPDFDKAYIDAQVKNHQSVLDAIDKQILPAVKNAELKAALEGFRPKVEAHLKEAKDIQTALAAAPAPAAATSATPAAGAAPAKK
ncbi:MAG: DUF4142 domain-containing protein [Polyangiaceae bacterium]